MCVDFLLNTPTSTRAAVWGEVEMEGGRVVQRLDTTTLVETPERVQFRILRAGPGLRAASGAIDLMLQAGLVATVGGAAFALGWRGLDADGAGWEGVGWGWLSVWVFLIQWFFLTVCEVFFQGQTPGKALLGLRVVRSDGTPAGVGDLVLRNVMRAVDWLPAAYGCAAVAMLVDADQRRVGDVVAGTMVIRRTSILLQSEPFVDPPTDAERRSLPPHVDLHVDEVASLRSFFLRRGSLSDARAEELAALWGPALSARTGIAASRWERVLALTYWVAIRAESVR